MKAEEILDSFRYYTGEHNHARYNEINQAYRNILKRTKWWNTRIRKEDLLSLSPNQYKYKVDFSCFRGGTPTHVFLKSIESDNWGLITESKFQYFENSRPRHNSVDSDNSVEYPTKYFLSGDSKYNFYVSPTPNQEVVVRFDGVKAIEELKRGVEPVIHKDYHDAIALLASSIFLKQKKGVTQEDILRSNSLKMEAEAEIRSLIDDAHSNKTGNLSWQGTPLMY
jgi:hypothetical protein